MDEIFSLGQWIKRRRKALDLTQDELAARRLLEGTDRQDRSRRAPALAPDRRTPGRPVQLAPEERVRFSKRAGRAGVGSAAPADAQRAPSRLRCPAARVCRVEPSPSCSPISKAAPSCGSSTRRRCAPRSPATTPSCAQAIDGRGGVVFKTGGRCRLCRLRQRAAGAAAALAAQRALQPRHGALIGSRFGVRMALHTGAAEERDGDYFGPPLNRVARLLAAGHGGQVLLSLAHRAVGARATAARRGAARPGRASPQRSEPARADLPARHARSASRLPAARRRSMPSTPTCRPSRRR